jgi:hypothetical protein
MTRKSRREIVRTVEDLESDADADAGTRRPTRTVYRDPVTGGLFEGRARDAAPVEALPEDARLLVLSRTESMTRADAEAADREIVEVTDEHAGTEVVAVRVEPPPDVDPEAAVTVGDEQLLGSAISLGGLDT